MVLTPYFNEVEKQFEAASCDKEYVALGTYVIKYSPNSKGHAVEIFKAKNEKTANHLLEDMRTNKTKTRNVRSDPELWFKEEPVEILKEIAFIVLSPEFCEGLLEKESFRNIDDIVAMLSEIATAKKTLSGKLNCCDQKQISALQFLNSYLQSAEKKEGSFYLQ